MPFIIIRNDIAQMNVDVAATVERFGIDRSRAQNFHNESKGVELNYCIVSEAVASVRAAPMGARLREDWNAEIEADFKTRGGQR